MSNTIQHLNTVRLGITIIFIPQCQVEREKYYTGKTQWKFGGWINRVVVANKSQIMLVCFVGITFAALHIG